MLKRVLIISLAILITINIALLTAIVLYKGEVLQIRHLMTKAEQRKLEAYSTTKANRAALSRELTRRMAKGDTDFHLTVDTQKGVMYLAREGAILREMKIQMGKEVLVGLSPDYVRLSLPRGKRQVVDIVDSNFAWTVPNWLTVAPDSTSNNHSIVGGLGPLAIMLDSGTIIYSRPDVGPLSNNAYVLPGSIRMTTEDVAAIRKAVRPGMVVYFY
jgi:predicted Holliday junction resolvase-like endonuclease